ncbi:SpoIVB peptidase [Clostridium sp. MSJ-4]|uniref:SpoIVB peptidase n=1 Tax=Clostridium simiarum TaxID=2841506 RepID=A0ABS6EXD7_9CLOT|nr:MULTISPECIES: SpoIVB peptidase [Clostridium]MBU5590741.1 SpoIVB peptidase [Clostridium simiarum]
MKKKVLYKLCFILTPIFILFSIICFDINRIPSTIFVKENERISINHVLKNNLINNKFLQSSQASSKEKIDIKILGILPVKSAMVKSVPDVELCPGGDSIGIKLSTQGVLVVAYSDIEKDKEKSSSIAAEAGIEVGDSIIKVDGVEINSAEEMAKLINKSEGKNISLTIKRKEEIFEKNILPIKNKEGKYKIGLWVRDSTSGVGTLTFYHSKSKKFGALGHPITDVDTGKVMSIKKGEVTKASVINIKKGVKGNPGELKGIFTEEDAPLGMINNNTECGIFGDASQNINNLKLNQPLKIALRNEIKEGPAEIITTLDDHGPKRYAIEIEKLLPQDVPGPKSMVIKVTDKELLEKTGGIVQGMSGSPIIQNNKIIGAVTHVLINKPDTGYGIYIEWMIKDSGIID